MPRNQESGQALVMTALAIGVLLIGAIGLALDTAQLYAHRQMAQAAADAAAQAAILSIFNQTNVGSNSFAASTAYSHTCGTTDAITPCSYARKNGFGGTADDAVLVDVPTAAAAGIDPGILSTDDPVSLIRVTISRSVSTWFVPLLGAAGNANVRASAVAAIVGVNAPIPILVTHPSLSQALYTNSAANQPMITICGGPNQSVQVNSSAPDAYRPGGLIDLSRAGPKDDGTCSSGTGGGFGVFGGPTQNPGNVSIGSEGWYLSPSSIMEDPFLHIAQPTAPGTLGGFTHIPVGTDGCTYADGCVEYTPGLYTGGLNPNVPNGQGLIFKPGLYYLQGGGFTLKNLEGGGGPPDYNGICPTCSDPDTGNGIAVFDTGPSGSSLGNNPSGGFDINTNVSITLHGPTNTTLNSKGKLVPAGPYYNILFWEDRTADAHVGNKAHTFGQGNGCFTLIGNIYATNPVDYMRHNPTHYQEVDYNGNPCSTTVQKGNIVVSNLHLVGATQIKMNLDSSDYLMVRKIALVQ